MPIHDQGYRRYGGERTPPGRAWSVIAKAGIRTLISKRAFIALLLLAWLPFIVRTVQIYAATSLPQAAFLAPDARMFRQFLEQQEVFLFFITVYAGAGLIATDRRANALQIYLSKPLSRVEYIFGKLTILATFLLFVTWLPAVFLLIIQIVFSGSFKFFLDNLFLFPAITIFSFIQVVAVASAMLALSSLSNSSRYVGVLYTGLLFFSQALYGIVLRNHARFAVRVDIGCRRSQPDRRRHFQYPAQVADVGSDRLRGGRRPHHRVGGDSREASPRRRGCGVSVIAADHLSKWYGQVIGLNDVTLQLPAGITGLLGPNGAGKSTFMKLITGQLAPSKGTITVLGEPIWRNPSLYFRIGFCPEQDAFYERMTGLEWVTALVRLNGLDEKQAGETARHALDLVDLTDAAHKKIGAYSKGMRQRVKLAQALAHDPELLILDEPLSGMDPLARRKTIRMIKEWAKAGRSIIVSSHVLHEIESMTSNILLINQGRILAEGNVHQIRDLIDEHPHTVHVRAAQPRALAREFLAEDNVLSLRFEEGAVIVQTARPDAFYARLTDVAASGEFGAIHEVTSPDDNLQAVFQYLVKG